MRPTRENAVTRRCMATEKKLKDPAEAALSFFSVAMQPLDAIPHAGRTRRRG